MGDDIALVAFMWPEKKNCLLFFVCHRRLQDQPRVNVAAGGTAVIRGSPGRRMSLVATMLFGINFLLTADTKLGGLYRTRLSPYQAS